MARVASKELHQVNFNKKRKQLSPSIPASQGTLSLSFGQARFAIFPIGSRREVGAAGVFGVGGGGTHLCAAVFGLVLADGTGAGARPGEANQREASVMASNSLNITKRGSLPRPNA